MAPVPDRGNEETITVAGIKQGGHKPDIIFVVKRDSMVLSVNHPVYGAPGAGMVGHSILVLFAQEHSAAITRSFETVFASGEPQSFVVRGNPPLPIGAWYHCRVSPNHSDSGVQSATLFARDITEWKHTEDEYEELNRFRAVLNRAGEAIFVTDASTGRLVDVNETACSWLGFSREKLLQMEVRDLNLEFPLESGDGVFDHVADTRDANRPRALVCGSHRRQNGTSFPVEVTLSQQRFGDRDFLLVVARDVKQRSRTKQSFLESETERRGLFAISRDAGYCSARDGTVSEVNDSALQLFGYTRDEFLGLEARKLYRLPEQIRAFQHAVEERGAVKNFRAEFQTKSGLSFQGFLGATKRYDSDGNVLGYQCFISPIRETASLDSRDTVAEAKLDAEEATRRADALEKEAKRIKREIEETRSVAAKAKLAAAEWKKRADALERETEEAKRETEQARSEAAAARVDAEHGMTAIAIAKLDADDAKKLADTLEREVERAKREMEDARSEAATARADTERAESLAAKTRLAAEAWKQRAETLQRVAEQTKSDLEDARSEAAKARLDAEKAEERAQQLQREAESKMSDTQKAVVEAANAWANLEKAEREARATSAAAWAVTSDPMEVRTGQGSLVHVKRRLSTDTLSSEKGSTPLLTGPVVRHRRRTEPLMQPSRRRGTAAWLGVAVKKVAGLLALPSDDGHTGNRAATASDSLKSSVEEVRSPGESITPAEPGSETHTFHLPD